MNRSDELWEQILDIILNTEPLVQLGPDAFMVDEVRRELLTALIKEYQNVIEVD